MSFSIGQRVWCKVKGSPAWPSVVADPAKATEYFRDRSAPKGQVLVWFYGSNNGGYAKADQLTDFKKGFDTLSTKSKNKSFLRGVDEAKADPGPVPFEKQIKKEALLKARQEKKDAAEAKRAAREEAKAAKEAKKSAGVGKKAAPKSKPAPKKKPAAKKAPSKHSSSSNDSSSSSSAETDSSESESSSRPKKKKAPAKKKKPAAKKVTQPKSSKKAPRRPAAVTISDSDVSADSNLVKPAKTEEEKAKEEEERKAEEERKKKEEEEARKAEGSDSESSESELDSESDYEPAAKKPVAKKTKPETDKMEVDDSKGAEIVLVAAPREVEKKGPSPACEAATEIAKVLKGIESPVSGDENVAKVVSQLKAAEGLTLTPDDLIASEVGVAVSKYRKDPCEEVASLAKSLRAAWKALITASVAPAPKKKKVAARKPAPPKKRKATPKKKGGDGDSQVAKKAKTDKGKEAVSEPAPAATAKPERGSLPITLDELKKKKEALASAFSSNDVAAAAKLCGQLVYFNISAGDLASSELGKVVYQHRKHDDESVRKRCRLLVAQWKKVIG